MTLPGTQKEYRCAECGATFKAPRMAILRGARRCLDCRYRRGVERTVEYRREQRELHQKLRLVRR